LLSLELVKGIRGRRELYISRSALTFAYRDNKDGNVGSELAKKRDFLVDGHVDVPDQNSHLYASVLPLCTPGGVSL
jgi:hypothetical protein